MTNELSELVCTSCSKVMAYGRSLSEGDLTTITVICICGKKNSFDFIGYPRLAGTAEIYFDFTDETEITCQKR